MSKFYKKDRLFLFIALFAILSFILVFIIFYGKTDLFRFPFDSRVWGTASDWSMVIVTICTAIYLILTFRQQKMATDISLKNHRKSIRPRLSITTNEIKKVNELKYLILHVNENDLYNFNVVCHTKDFHTISTAYPSFLSKDQGFWMYVTRINLFHLGPDIKIATFTFEDVEGNKYSQLLTRDGHFINIQSPLYIRD